MSLSTEKQTLILRFAKKGVPQAQIARNLGVSRPTVAKIINEGEISPSAKNERRRYLSKAFFTVEVEEGDTPEGIQKCYDEMGIRLKYIDTKSEDGKDIFIYRHLA